ncbi:MAG: iron chaperone [Chloroflexota bacterium]
MSPVAKKAPRKSTTAAAKSAQTFTAEERAAMQARAQELKAEARANRSREEGERELLAAIAAMQEPDRGMATRLHVVVKASAPALMPKTWYGMPAYALDDKVVCFFKGAQKFKDRYGTFGFNDKARLDDGAMWPTTFALKALNAEVEKRIAALVKQAVGK